MNQILYHQKKKGVLQKSRVRRQLKTKKRTRQRKFRTKSKFKPVIKAHRNL